jgi:multiple sugar transport system permease protein
VKIKRKEIGNAFIILWTAVIVLFLLFPFFVMISTMLKPHTEVYVSPPYWIPKAAALSNFAKIWTQHPFARYFVNSFVIAAGTTVLTTALCVPAAYAVSRFRFLGRKFLLYLYLVVQMFSPIIVVIALFKIVARLHLLNTYLGLILVNTVFTLSFVTWMLAGYFKTIPVDIEEAALIDGCTRMQTIVRIMIPIAAPGLVTTIIYSFIASWNEFMFALTLVQSIQKTPLTLGLYNFVGRYTTQWEFLTAAAFLAIIPIIVLFLLIEKELVAGIVGGAVKG